mmetsp:Transcript_27373/g.63762  ORF Transcript_27373/g.63762 Transcript_27373/m.63762 type:complete len:91 (+) Transcript_27373:622-894(+)
MIRAAFLELNPFQLHASRHYVQIVWRRSDVELLRLGASEQVKQLTQSHSMDSPNRLHQSQKNPMHRDRQSVMFGQDSIPREEIKVISHGQ